MSFRKYQPEPVLREPLAQAVNPEDDESSVDTDIGNESVFVPEVQTQWRR